MPRPTTFQVWIATDDTQTVVALAPLRASSTCRCSSRSTMRSSWGRNGCVGSGMPSKGPRASIAGFHSVVQFRRLATPNRMHNPTGPGGSGWSTTSAQARWIVSFQAMEAVETLVRTVSAGGGTGAVAVTAGPTAIVEWGW